MDLLTLPRAAFATTLGVATAVRGARVFHPHGVTRRATLTVSPTWRWGARLLDQAGQHDGQVRLSRGVGLPQPLPDVDGFALRLPGLGLDGAPLDVLVNSAWRFAFAPSVLAPTWSAVLPHRTGADRLVLLGARPHEGGFMMLAAEPLGPWQPWGELLLGEELEAERVRYAPTLGAADLKPVELFRSLRAWSYEASSAGRD